MVNNDSSYTHRIVKCMDEYHSLHEIRPYYELNENEIGRYSSYILTGRRANNVIMNAVNSKVVRHAVSDKKPMLGICYGAQILALTLGGTIRKMQNRVSGIHRVSMESNDSIFGSGTLHVYQSHSYVIGRLPESLHGVGSSETCRYEVVKHYSSMIYGTQFHPEMSDDGIDALGRFLNCVAA